MVTKINEKELKAINSKDVKVRMEGQRADRNYLRNNYQNLLKKYRNQWIVISGGKLIKAESNPDRLLTALDKSKKADMLVFYLADPEDFMIL
jgi:hypothetical protein